MGAARTPVRPRRCKWGLAAPHDMIGFGSSSFLHMLSSFVAVVVCGKWNRVSCSLRYGELGAAL